MTSVALSSAFVVARGVRLHYWRWSSSAPKSAGDLVLIHGLASSSWIWNLVAPYLAQQGYTVTALDQRGHGESEKPDTGYDFASIVADDHDALQSLAIHKPVLVGHSWGAAVALEYATRYPDEIAGLVLVDGAMHEMSQRDWSREQFLQELAPPRFAGTPARAYLSYMRSGPLGQQWSAELEDILLHIVQLREDNTVAPRLKFENHMQILSAIWDQPTFALYQQAKCPITLIVADPAPGKEPRPGYMALREAGLTRIQTLRPQTRLLHMPDTIHDIPLQRPQQLAEEILHFAATLPV